MRSPERTVTRKGAALLGAGVLISAALLSGCGEDAAQRVAPGSTASPKKPPASSGAATPATPGTGTPQSAGTYAVIGVASDDRLNVRRAPRVDSAVVTRLAPLRTGLVGVGKARQNGRQSWQRIRVGGRTGWVNAAYLGRLGSTREITGELEDVSVAPTRVALARRIGKDVAGPTEGSRAGVVVVASTRKAVTVDTLGVADDSVLGSRLRIITEMGEAGWAARSVHATVICARGVTAAGECL